MFVATQSTETNFSKTAKDIFTPGSTGENFRALDKGSNVVAVVNSRIRFMHMIQRCVRLRQGDFISWSIKILCLARQKQKLLTTTAYVSTFGGGFFLCRYVDCAQRMAATQYWLARHLHDTPLVIQSCIHMAYSLIQEGKYAMAANIIRAQQQAVMPLKNDPIVSVVRNAGIFLERMRCVKLKVCKIKRWRSCVLPHHALPVERVAISESDNFHRHHIVQFVD